MVNSVVRPGRSLLIVVTIVITLLFRIAPGHVAALPSPPSPADTLVTARLKSYSLGDALTWLTKSTGEQMSADSDVRDLRVTILVRRLPIATLRDRLGELLNLTWTFDSASHSYRLTRNQGNRNAERDLPLRGERAFREGVANALKWLAAAPGEQNRLLSAWPVFAQSVHAQGGKITLKIFSELDARAQSQILDGKTLELAPESLSPKLASDAAELRRTLDTRDTRRPPIPADATLSIGRTDAGADSALGGGFSWRKSTSSGAVGTSLQVTSTRTVLPRFYGGDRDSKEYVDARKTFLFSKPPNGKNLDDLLVQLADELGIDVIAERYFESRALRPPDLPKTEGSVEEVLDRALGPRDCFWWKLGRVYVIQKRNWWDARRSQITDSALNRLRSIFRRDPMTLDDWGEVGTLLRVEQVGRVETERIAYLLGAIEDKLPGLAFYGSLPQAQKAAMFSQGGLDWAKLSGADRQRMANWVGLPTEKLDEAARAGSVKALAVVRPEAIPMERTVFRAVARSKDGIERTLRESFAPGEPPSAARAGRESQ